jgi:hypothetical protein
MPDYVRSFNRYEFKYVFRQDRITDLLGAMNQFVYPDPHCGHERGYRVCSVYFDSAQRSLFWEKIEGTKFRRKIRVRRYADDDHAYLEIKQRLDRTVQKRRVRWPLQRAADVLGAGDGAEFGQDDERDAVASEATFLQRHYNLAPCMAISYRRLAYFCHLEAGQRITFDTDIRYDAHQLEIERPSEIGKHVLDPTLVVMELKFNDRVPLWLCKIIGRFDLRMVRLSKYCTAVDREYFQGSLT